MAGPLALTGTPGTGKSSVARVLARRWTTREVGELALELGAARRRRGAVEVDLARLRRRLARPGALADVDLVVGHLAHLLPIRDVVVLRCHPAELARRLARAHRGSPADRRENVLAEATDVVLGETLGAGHRVWEIDTSARPVRDVARAVERRLTRRGASSYGAVDWLSDPRVTAHLLDPPP